MYWLYNTNSLDGSFLNIVFHSGYFETNISTNNFERTMYILYDKFSYTLILYFWCIFIYSIQNILRRFKYYECHIKKREKEREKERVSERLRERKHFKMKEYLDDGWIHL